MNVLMIGNSFSEDASRYLHAIAKSDGVDLNTCNLYIGGCPLSLHYQNMQTGKAAYELQVNGQKTDFFVGIEEMLRFRKWDVISLQQVSQDAISFRTYEPYLTSLAAFVRKLCPSARLFIHQTWAYEDGSARLTQELGYGRREEMLQDVVRAYHSAKETVHADALVPSGELFDLLLRSGIQKVHRDTFHASFGLGRYALALLWYAVLTGNDVEKNDFCCFDEPVSEQEIAIVKQCVKAITER